MVFTRVLLGHGSQSVLALFGAYEKLPQGVHSEALNRRYNSQITINTNNKGTKGDRYAEKRPGRQGSGLVAPVIL